MGKYKKVFYTVEENDDYQKKYENSYRFVCLVANEPVRSNVNNILQEKRFGKKIGLSNLYSVPIEYEVYFDKVLKENNFKFTKYDLENKYEEYLQETEPNESYEILDTSFLQGQQPIYILDVDVPEIILSSGENRSLTEGTVDRKDNIKIYIHTNEKCGHHIPHIHVKYNENDNYCVLSLVDLSVIVPEKLKKSNAKLKEIRKLVTKNMQKARKEWNSCDNLLKFAEKDGVFLDDYAPLK